MAAHQDGQKFLILGCPGNHGPLPDQWHGRKSGVTQALYRTSRYICIWRMDMRPIDNRRARTGVLRRHGHLWPKR
ncbi:hypothetical protein HBI56_067110 [Parastagonospora nodorum]|uniref:Uncharacterized protein n=1 Tax=Phaeosphaeria nodorum (strain SN15 / ATCC MYA-4574 / FGSC 10173) TaxID=321614 RepID=A0A7U2EQJ4_PHANO|nr:hypothetical protein HBH56_001610 [Parastagonospora nodorum]QRC90138.1 hypothetical protein JI435_400220 [Parastagonospora nodorum SN15]KAH3937698.1 hypothetical protein HBH54_001620 [Parastagonospora nodorum]KAH3940886.1 hypothetical protein HBH53_210920 [Parastagonospora nodorum]KAH3958487.1 hypothetical protein HBH51_209450 [Parastagonospora nodorum]